MGLDFKVVWPLSLVNRAYNDDFCVVRIHDGFHSVLLAGDLENKGEYRLLQYHDFLQSDVVIVPHHGSKGTSNLKWASAISAKYVLNSSEPLSRWHLPLPILNG